jgi:hypothetical protein
MLISHLSLILESANLHNIKSCSLFISVHKQSLSLAATLFGNTHAYASFFLFIFPLRANTILQAVKDYLEKMESIVLSFANVFILFVHFNWIYSYY